MTKTRDLADLGGGFIQVGSGAAQRTVESKLQDVVSVADFGAVGDGTDETVKIENAINATPVGGKLIFPKAISEYRTTNFIRIQKSIDIDCGGNTIASTAPGFIFLISSKFDEVNKIEYTPAITKGQVTFAIAPPTGTVVGSYLWIEYGTDPNDPFEQDYTKIVQVTAVSAGSFTIDWGPSEDINYLGNPRTNYFTPILSIAQNITIRNIVTRDINRSIDGIFRVGGCRNVLIENHTVNGGGICGVRFQDTENLTYRNVHAARMQLAMAGWNSQNLLLENCYWSALKSPLILNTPSCIGSEASVVNFKVSNVRCFIPASETVLNVFDFSGASRNCSIENAEITGPFTNLTSTFDNSIYEIYLNNIQVFDRSSFFNVPQLIAGNVNNLYDDELDVYFNQSGTYEETLTIPLYGNVGPVPFASGLISDIWLYCTDWSLISSLLIRNSTGGGFNSSTYSEPLTDNQWIRLSSGFIASIGNSLNADYGNKNYILNLSGTSTSDYLKIRYCASRNTNGAYARPGRTTEELSTVGTFTPQLISSNGDMTASTTSGFVGSYIKAGKLIYFTLFFTSSVTAAGTGNVRVTGFPFRLASTSILNINSFRFLTAAPIGARLAANNNYIDLYTEIGSVSGVGGLAALPVANITTSNAFANGISITGVGISV